jgi:hypothetical protein
LPETATIAAPAGFGSHAVAPDGREIQCQVFLDARFLQINTIFSGAHAQFFQICAIVLFAWRLIKLTL